MRSVKNKTNFTILILLPILCVAGVMMYQGRYDREEAEYESRLASQVVEFLNVSRIDVGGNVAIFRVSSQPPYLLVDMGFTHVYEVELEDVESGKKYCAEFTRYQVQEPEIKNMLKARLLTNGGSGDMLWEGEIGTEQDDEPNP